MIIRIRIIPVVLVVLCSILLPIIHTDNTRAASGFDAGRIIDDSIFTDPNSMSENEIQIFLINKNSTCLINYVAPEPLGNNQYGGNVTAARTIWKSAQLFNISPKVLLATLQKENGLVTRQDCPDWRYKTAMGFGCPDTAPCDAQWYGLSKQLYQAARHFRGYYDQSAGWYIPFTPGVRYVQYNPNGACGGSNVNITNRATASLYSYTPYQPNQSSLDAGYGIGDSCGAYGNRNFWLYYTQWFGSPISDQCFGGYDGGVNTNVLFRKQGRTDYADFTIYAGSGTGCIESHIWNNGFTSWKSHTASIQPSVEYPQLQLLYGDLDGSGNDYPVLFGLQGTSTGMVESHVLSQNMKSYLAHAASNRTALNPSDMNIRLADLNGDGKDEPIIVAYRNTGSGMVELHGWGVGMQSWIYHIATNRAALDPADNIIEFGDIDGDGKDEAILIALRNTGSGRVEFHVWNPGQWSWRTHIVSNTPEINPNDSKIEFADTDGNGVDEPVLIGLRNTGSGRVEFHVWNPGFTSWKSHQASNQPIQ